MRIFPVLIDARPSYLEVSSTPTSLLLTPLGSSTLLGQFESSLAEVSQNPLTVLTSFDPSGDYTTALRRACGRIESIIPAQAFRAQLPSYEPSDWLLIADARRVPARGFDFAGMVQELVGDTQRVRHQVALETAVGGTKECIQAGPEGRVMRLQRYYESVTWPFTEGIPCSFVPVASTAVAGDLPFSSLDKLRVALAMIGVPSGDLTLPGGAFDLFDEQGLLALSERSIMQLSVYRKAAGRALKPLIGRRCNIHPRAKLIGPIVVHDDVTIGEGATIIGPALLGTGSRVEPGAVVAHCLVFQGSSVEAETTVRQKVVVTSSAGLESPKRRTIRLQEERFKPFVGPPGGYHETLSDLSQKAPKDIYPWVKSALEAILALVALLLLSPVLVLVAIAVKLDSRGPIFYGHDREGRGGLPFRCWKVRTMRPDAEALQRRLLAANQVDGPQFKMDKDPRVTRVGRVLRPTNLDELPQLVNVLLGQMSFVGPRPSPFRENQMCVPWREARLSVRPGITGLWQVCRHERASGDFHQWIYYDLLYVRLLSPGLDLRILAATVVAILGRRSIPLSAIIDPEDFQDRRRGRPPVSSLIRSSFLQL